MAGTKIFLIRREKLICSGIILFLLILVLTIISVCSSDSTDTESEADTAYVPGVYNCATVMDDKLVNMEMIVDKNQIKSVRITDSEQYVDNER